MKKFLALVIGALVYVTVPAAAQAPQCAPLELVLANVKQKLPVKQVVKLDAEQAALAVAWHNAQPPVTEDAYNLVVVLLLEDGRLALLLGNDNVGCAGGILPPEAIRSFLKAVFGDAA